MVNEVLCLSILSWAVAQVLKFLIHAAVQGRFDRSYLFTGGGMPSSHSSFVCTCATGVGVLSGVSSVSFAISVALALIVMYDAANVRRVTGEQAKILNYMMEHWQEMKPEEFPAHLKELIGHTWLQVIAGAALGIAIGAAGCLLWPK